METAQNQKSAYAAPGLVKRSLTAESIDTVVCLALGADQSRMKEQTRKGEVVKSRQISMYFQCKFTTQKLREIASRYGLKHSAVIHSRKTVNNLMETSKTYRTLILKIELDLLQVKTIKQ